MGPHIVGVSVRIKDNTWNMLGTEPSTQKAVYIFITQMNRGG